MGYAEVLFEESDLSAEALERLDRAECRWLFETVQKLPPAQQVVVMREFYREILSHFFRKKELPKRYIRSVQERGIFHTDEEENHFYRLYEARRGDGKSEYWTVALPLTKGIGGNRFPDSRALARIRPRYHYEVEADLKWYEQQKKNQGLRGMLQRLRLRFELLF